ncbi:MAG: hypothetical protein Q4G42_01450 [Neisseria sp.]|nr:hypothetical protein [Neisseria sp.]
MKHHLFALTILALISPAYADNSALNAMINKDFSAGFILPYGLVKSQSTVNFTVGGLIDGFAQLAYQCETNQLSLNFVAINGKHYYPNQKNEYAPPQNIASTRATKLLQSPEIQAACQSRPDYRLAGKVVIDINSLKPAKNFHENAVEATIFHPQASVLRDIPYNNPYEFKAEKLIVACDRQQSVIVQGYDVYRNQVSDVGFLLLMQPYPLAQNVLAAVCQPNVAKKLPKYTFPEQWQPEPAIEAPQLSEDLKKLVAPYQIGTPKYTVHKITVSGKNVYKNKSEPFSTTIHIQATDTPNIFYINEKSSYTHAAFTFLGWVELSSYTDFLLNNISYDSDILMKYQQSAIWQNAPVGTAFEYQTNVTNATTMFGLKEIKREYDCKITQELPAKKLHQNIKGQAKEIQCHYRGDEYRRLLTGYYLMDYHYYVELRHSPNEFYYSDVQITEFE